MIVSPVPEGTIGELEEFSRIAKEQRTGDLAVLATETHLGRIQRRLRRDFVNSGNIKVFSVERVLTEEVPTRRYLKLIETLRNSEDEKEFKRREELTEKIEKIPFGSYIVDALTRSRNRWAIWNSIKKLLQMK